MRAKAQSVASRVVNGVPVHSAGVLRDLYLSLATLQSVTAITGAHAHAAVAK